MAFVCASAAQFLIPKAANGGRSGKKKILLINIIDDNWRASFGLVTKRLSPCANLTLLVNGSFRSLKSASCACPHRIINLSASAIYLKSGAAFQLN